MPLQLALREDCISIIGLLIFWLIFGAFFGTFICFPNLFFKFFALIRKPEKVIHLKAGTYTIEEYIGPIGNYLKGGMSAKVIVSGEDKYVTTAAFHGNGGLTLYQTKDADRYDERYIYVNAVDDNPVGMLPWYIKAVLVLTVIGYAATAILIPFRLTGEQESQHIAMYFFSMACLGGMTVFAYKGRNISIFTRLLYWAIFIMFTVTVFGGLL